MKIIAFSPLQGSVGIFRFVTFEGFGLIVSVASFQSLSHPCSDTACRRIVYGLNAAVIEVLSGIVICPAAMVGLTATTAPFLFSNWKLYVAALVAVNVVITSSSPKHTTFGSSVLIFDSAYTVKFGEIIFPTQPWREIGVITTAYERALNVSVCCMVNFPAVPNTLPLSITTLVNNVRNSYATVSTLVPLNVISNDSFVPLQKFGAVEVYILGAGLIVNSCCTSALPQFCALVAVTRSTYVPAGKVSVLLKSIEPSILVELPPPFTTPPDFVVTV